MTPISAPSLRLILRDASLEPMRSPLRVTALVMLRQMLVASTSGMVIRLLILEGASGQTEFSWANHAGNVKRIEAEIRQAIPDLHPSWLKPGGTDLYKAALAVGTRFVGKSGAEDLVQAAVAGLSESGARRRSSDFYGVGGGKLRAGVMDGHATPKTALANVSGVIKARGIDVLKKKKRRERALGGIRVEDMRVEEENLRAQVPSFSQMTEGDQTDMIMQILQGKSRGGATGLTQRMRRVLKGIWRRKGNDVQQAIMSAFLDLVAAGVSPANLNKQIAKQIADEGFINPRTDKTYTQQHISIERIKMEQFGQAGLKGTTIMKDLDDVAFIQQLGYGSGYAFPSGQKKRKRRVANMIRTARIHMVTSTFLTE